MKIRTGDTVLIISGKDKGKTGKVMRVLHAKNRLVVSDVNIRTRHIRRTPNRAGEIVKYEAALSASNVMLVDPKSGKRTRVGYVIDEKGRKTRVARRSGEEIKKAASTKPVGKEAKEAKETKEAREKMDAKKSSASLASSDSSASSSKQPFWKKMGFGAQEIAERGEIEGETHMQEDRSVPEQIERQSQRSHQRGS